MADAKSSMHDQVKLHAIELSEHMQRTGETMDQAEARLYSQRSSLNAVL